ncbi:hypothetical protein GCM10010442_00770 [Kitasatospora kifunensis]
MTVEFLNPLPGICRMVAASAPGRPLRSARLTTRHFSCRTCQRAVPLPTPPTDRRSGDPFRLRSSPAVTGAILPDRAEWLSGAR